ncbi:tetratricopeptide repeat protein [Candidatus Hodarchaeum mangrovi]
MNANLRRGIDFIREAENSKAIDSLLVALKEDEDNPEIYRNLGLASYNLGNYEDAQNFWKKALELDPNNHLTWWSLGNLLESQEFYHEAYIAYLRANKEAISQNNINKATRYQEWANRLRDKLNK